MEPQEGIEPSSPEYKTGILPLNYCGIGRGGGIRTHTTRILSPLSLPVGLHPHMDRFIYLSLCEEPTNPQFIRELPDHLGRGLRDRTSIHRVKACYLTIRLIPYSQYLPLILSLSIMYCSSSVGFSLSKRSSIKFSLINWKA